MSEVVEFLKSVAGKSYVRDGDTEYRLELLPSLSANGIAALEREVGAPLPTDLIELLEFCGGLRGPFDEPVDFSGGAMMSGQELPNETSNLLTVAVDGYGNSWAIDLTGEREARALVWYVSHDPPVLLIQSRGILDFVQEVVKRGTKGSRSLVDRVHDDEMFNVWGTNPGLVTREDALASSDPVLSAFAKELEDNFFICDLRKAPVGMGFSWGRFGPNSTIKRAGKDRIFAYDKPVKTSFLKKLFG